MYIIATFIGDDTFSHLIDTNKLESNVKTEVEAKIKSKRINQFSSNYFTKLQDGAVTDESIYPVTIEGMVDVYLE